MKTVRMLTTLLLGSSLALAVSMPSFAADKVKAGVVRSMGGSPNFVAKEKGFFAEQGIDVELVFFELAQPIAVAVASGDCDVGTTGVTAAFFNLAAQGTLRIVGSGTWEHPTFQSIGYLVSNQAYEAGLHSLKDIAGKKAGITQSGTPLQYAIALAAEKYHIDYGKISDPAAAIQSQCRHRVDRWPDRFRSADGGAGLFGDQQRRRQAPRLGRRRGR